MFFNATCRPNSEQMWKEVAERYQQIIEKDNKLLQYPRSPNVFTQVETGLTATCSLEDRHVNNNQCSSRPAMLVPRKMNMTANLSARNEENKDVRNFPKIVKVFSLDPSVPVRHFQEHVTVRVVPSGIIVEPSVDQSFKNNGSNKLKLSPKIGENVKEKLRHFVDCHTASRQENNNRQTSPNKISFKIEQSAVTTTNYMDLKVGENESKIVIPLEGNSGNEIFSGCKTTQKDNIPDTDDINNTMSIQKASEEVNSERNAKTNKKKRKRKTIFGPRRAKKKSRMGNCDDTAKPEEHIPDGKCVSDEIEKENDFCNSPINDIIDSIDNNSEDRDIERQEKSMVCNLHRKQDDEGKPGRFGEQAHKCNDVTESGKKDFSSSLPTVSHFQGNSLRQNKILDLKEKLARQEQELQELKQKRESAEMKESGAYAGIEPGARVDGTVVLGNNIYLDSSRHAILCTQNEEKDRYEESVSYLSDPDVNPGKLDDLKEIFQKVIKSFRIFDTRMYMTKTGMVIDYGDLRSKNEITDKNVFAHVDNRMKLLPEDVASKEEFLLQLGLLRL